MSPENKIVSSILVLRDKKRELATIKVVSSVVIHVHFIVPGDMLNMTM